MVERWSIDGVTYCPVKKSDGAFVRYFDYAALEAQLAENARLRERVAELEKAMFSVQVLAVSSAACWHQKELENVLTKIEQVACRVREGGKVDG